MANEVYANGREVSCKAARGKIDLRHARRLLHAAARRRPRRPGVPIPYPNTGMASDTTDGSTTVKISGKEVMLKNKSYFKKSIGRRGGLRAPRKGVVTSKNMGKVYFIAWSMDVKVEGENVVRHLDMTTHNHGSPTANEAVPWPFVDKMPTRKIKDAVRRGQEEGKGGLQGLQAGQEGRQGRVRRDRPLGATSHSTRATSTGAAKKASANDCPAARRCRLVPFNATPERIGRQQRLLPSVRPATTSSRRAPSSSKR